MSTVTLCSLGLLTYIIKPSSIKIILPIAGFIYWLPKWFFIKSLNYLFPKVITNTDKNILITIDDVPYGNESNIIEKLDNYNMKCIFFVISDYINDTNRNVLIKAIKNGHQLGNHGKTNSMHALKTYEGLENEIKTCDEKIKELYQEANIELPQKMYYRPGCGVFNNQMFKIIKKYNYELMLGSIAPYDPFVICPYINYLYIICHIGENDIIVLHDRKWTLRLFDYLLPWLVKNNYLSAL